MPSCVSDQSDQSVGSNIMYEEYKQGKRASVSMPMSKTELQNVNIGRAIRPPDRSQMKERKTFIVLDQVFVLS